MTDEPPAFVTAAELRETERTEEEDGHGGRFHIPEHPTRRYPRNGGVEYVGGTQFSLIPDRERSEAVLVDLVESTLSADRYRYGDWFDLPMPLYLVHDGVTGDTFRVSVRDGRIELHVLPETGSGGLSAFFERLPDPDSWRVERHTDSA